MLLGRIHERRLDGVRTPEAARNIITMRDALLGELLHRGGNVREGIGFMRKRSGYDAHGFALSVEALEAVCGLSPHTSARSSYERTRSANP